MPPRHRRSIIREEGFEASLIFLFPDWAEAELFVAAAEDVLSRDAEVGSPCGDGTWVLPMAPIRGADAWLFYHFYDTVVVLEEIQLFIT